MEIILLIFTLFFVISQNTNAQVTFAGFGCQGVVNNSRSSLLDRYRFFVSIISSESSTTKYYKVMIDDTHYNLYILYQCIEDKSQTNCKACINDAIFKILQTCPSSEEAVVWYLECMLQFAYHDIFSVYQTSPYYVLHNTNVPYDVKFGEMLAESLSATIQSVESGFTNGSHCATIETVLNSSMTLSNFAQCSRDLEVMQCKRCLQDAYGRFTNGYNATFLATTIFYPSCRLGYDNKPSFIGDGSLAPPPERSSDDGTNASMPPTILVIACVASFGLVFLIAGLWLYMWREPEESFEPMSISTHTSRHVAVEVVDDISNLESLQFNFEFIKTATSNFSWKNKLGRGGFGEVYKGKFLSGEEFAAKRLSGNSKQGVLEFKNEVHLLAKLQHKNLVKLLGFCMFEDEKILIFEFLSNLSLDKYLFDPVKRASLQWEQRFRIITGIARGLLYLHEDSRLKIIHRDLKASNILLDKEMNPKIADFGLARLFDSDQTQDVTSIIAGTYGYMAPEYVLAGQFSVKSDVYSFGVIVFEIISGQKNRFLYREEDEGLLQRAWRLWNEDKTLELVDRLMENKRYSEEQVKLCIQVGLLCIQEDTTRRPTMASLISALNGRSVTLPSPNAPHLFTIGTTSDGTSSNYALLSKNRNRNGRLRYDDSEYSGTTDITELCPR